MTADADAPDPDTTPNAVASPTTPPAMDLDAPRRAGAPTIEALLDPIRHGLTAEHLYQLAKTLSYSEIVPYALQGKPYNVFAVILRGLELGITPLTAICEINVIGGRTSLSSHLQVARVLSSGKAQVFRLVESTDEVAIVRVQRVDWDSPRDVSFTMGEARALGLDRPRGKSGAPSPYVSQPANMLRRRAYARACREYFPDVIIAYDPDELDVGTEPAAPTWAPPLAPAPFVVVEPAPVVVVEPDPGLAARQEEVRRRAAAAAPPPPEAPATLEEAVRDPDHDLVLEVLGAIAAATTKDALRAAGAPARVLKERGEKGDQTAAAHYAEIRRAYNARSKELA
jgi:hypothetical protein